MTDGPVFDLLVHIIRRESRSLLQYLREVPPWAGIRDYHAQARMNEFATAELELTEELARWLQRHFARPVHLGAFPDFTPYNDQALHYLLPMVTREQRQLLGELERDRPAVGEPEAGAMLDRLLALKRRHVPELDALITGPHSMTAAC